MLGAPRHGAPASGLLYLHGFNSGLGSPKLRLMVRAGEVLGLACAAPQLPHRPEAALALAEEALSALGPRPLLVGSSLGGFLASCLAERHGHTAVLINPALRPAALMADWIGERFVNDHTGEAFHLTVAHREALLAMTPERLTPERYLLLLGTADEALDCREAFAAYRGAATLLHPGGDHAFTALADYLPAVLAWGGHRLTPSQAASLVRALEQEAPSGDTMGIDND
ncbi:esterase [Halomonas pacifica]|uniref:YqiA/YcfP family alpha/beta fold hydrolase n=1 Tax=Bisbaumannia pacifica TaxID=77098 RepID=UPI0023598CB7|nr:YqiA/YcfP family alpha/beta fold hydrolase [Halomonas pacifica]MDC8803575.1 esterase [Halomonas pacifica]